MKLIKPKFIIPAVIIIILATLTAVTAIATPGDGNDPIVTLSYINDTVIPQLKEYVDNKFSSASQQNTASGSSSSSYNLVNVKSGQKIIGGEGTEFVLRMGSATIIATENGGVADLTSGLDLQNGSAVPANHNLLSPKNDSRGIHMSTDGIILIKGTYTVIPD